MKIVKLEKGFKVLTGGILAVSVLASSTACALLQTAENVNLDRGYSFGAELNYGGSAAKAGFLRTGTGKWQITAAEPFGLEGVVYDADISSGTSAGSSAKIGGLTANLTPAQLAQSVPGRIIAAFEEAVKKENVAVSAGKDTLIFTGADFVLKTNRAGIPVEAELNDTGTGKITAKFSNVKFTAFGATPKVPESSQSLESDEPGFTPAIPDPEENTVTAVPTPPSLKVKPRVIKKAKKPVPAETSVPEAAAIFTNPDSDFVD